MKQAYTNLILFTLVGLSATKVSIAQERPNIVFVLTDDQRFEMLGCTGHPVLKTPNIDRLAKDGVLFTNAHVSSAISMPSRTCILTGRSERSHGVNFNSGTALSEEAWMETYPMLLKDGGYYTGYIGKNHTPVGNKGYETHLMDNSFDYWYAGHEHLSFYPKKIHSIFKGAKADTQVEVIEEAMYDFLDPNERNLQGAVHFLNNRPEDQPFFMNICFNLPHGAGTSSMKMLDSDPEIYKSLYRDQELPLPENYIARADIKNPRLPAELLHVEDRQNIYDYVDTPEKLREMNTREMQAVTGIDLLVGKLVKELKDQKLDKNTIIIFSADHGIFNGEYGLGGKSLCYEICTKVPFIVYDPRAKATHGDVRDDLVSSLDIAPTILNYAQIEVPESYQGENLQPLLYDQEDKVRDYIFTENLWSTHFGNPRCESVQDKEWKYIRYYKNENPSANQKIANYKALGLPNNTIYQTNLTDVAQYRIFADAPLNGEKPVYEELFNLKNDPYEAVNLINANQYADLIEDMREQCDIQVRRARGEGQPRVDIITADCVSVPK